MDKMDESIFRFITKESLLSTGDRILIACSGGVDSVVLLHFMAANSNRLGIEVAAVHVDHMLRGVESEIDGVFVKELCNVYGIPFFSGTVPVPEIISEEGGNVQAICREGRYLFFSQVMLEHKYSVLATAHHAEDQLETVLMQVTKGRIPTGIPIKRKMEEGILIRPFLPVAKATIYSYAHENGLDFREDPSNDSDAYTRNRYRRHMLPFLLNENPLAAESAVSMSLKLQEDEALLNSLAKERLEEIVVFTEEGLPSINKHAFDDMPTALQRRIITLLLNYLYDKKNVPVEYKSGLIEQLLNHLSKQEGNVSIDLPLGYRFLKEYGKLTFVQGSLTQELSVQKVLPKGVQVLWVNNFYLYWTEIDNADLNILANAHSVMYFDFPEDALPLYVRHRRDGDRILLPGMINSKRISRLFIDEKVGSAERISQPVVVTAQDEVCALPGLRYGIAFTHNRTATDKYIFVLEKK